MRFDETLQYTVQTSHWDGNTNMGPSYSLLLSVLSSCSLLLRHPLELRAAGATRSIMRLGQHYHVCTAACTPRVVQLGVNTPGALRRFLHSYRMYRNVRNFIGFVLSFFFRTNRERTIC